MFFPSTAPKVSLGGRSTQGASREDVLKRTKLEREKRQRRKAEVQGATKIQARWRALTCRKRLKEQWRVEFESHLALGREVDILSTSNPLLRLFHRIYRPESSDDLHVLRTISTELVNSIERGFQGSFQWELACFHAAKVCTAILQTLNAQRDGLVLVLLDPLDAPHAVVHLQYASVAVQNLIKLTSPDLFGAQCSHSPARAHRVVSMLADSCLFPCLSHVLGATVHHDRPAEGPMPAVEALALHLMSQYTHVAQASPEVDRSQHAPWLLLAVPRILQYSMPMHEHCTALLPTILASLLPLSPRQLQTKISALASLLVPGTAATPGSTVLCCLQILSALAHSTCSTSVHLTAQHVVAFCRTTRLLIALLPDSARAQVSSVLSDVSGQGQCSLQVSVSACFGNERMDEDDDADNAFSGGDGWFLPRGLAPGGQSGSVPPTHAPETVLFPTPVAGTQVLVSQASACVNDGRFTAAEAVLEMTLWLFTALAMSRSDPLLRDKLVTAWANAPCNLIRVIWQQGLRLHAGARLPDTSAGVDSAPALWHAKPPTQPWMIMLMTLSAVYSQYVSSAPDDALFGEQAPIPKQELAPQADKQEAGEFIPFLRDALFFVVFCGQPGAGKAAPNPEVARPFKLLTGRLFGQLHSRAARRPDISDSCFQARDLQHARFLRDVKLALGLVDLFGEDGSEHIVEARLQSAYVDVLKYAPGMARFDDRAMVFQELVHRDREKNVSRQGLQQGGLVATIRRDHVFEDSLHLMSDLPSMDLKSKLRISFIDGQGHPEPGIDGGGLFKDFIENLLKEAFHPDLGIFLQTEDGAMFPNPAAKLPATSSEPDRSIADAFRLLGSMLGKAMYEGIIVELPLAAFFLKKLRGGSSDLNDLPSLDRQLYGNMMKLTDPMLDLESVGLHFTIISQSSTDEREVPLMQGGEHVSVTRENLPLYLTLVADYRLNRETAAHAAAFMHGFTKLIEPTWLGMFNDRELQQLISGDSRGGFDLDDFRENVILGGGYHAEHNIIQMFWRVLEKLDERQQSAFLKFVTACSRPPLLGFRYMQPPLAINMRGHVGSTSDETALPTASTCFNLLKLPPYQEESIMLDKLLLAIDGAQTFDLS